MYRLETGQTIADWCKVNNKPYATFWKYIAVEGLTPEQAIAKHKAKEGQPRKCKYWWKGVPLKHYCKEKGFLYSYIIRQIKVLDYTVEEVMAKYERL